MTDSHFQRFATRREFIKSGGAGIGLISLSSIAPAFLTESVRAGVATAENDRSILVLVQLAGGNDGLNTLVPYNDDHYFRLRPKIALAAKDLIKVDDQHGFHPACKEMAELFKEGDLSIVQNVGYPNPNRSHFRSMEIWETASKSNDYLNTGWLGRYFDSCCPGCTEIDPIAVNIGDELPDSLMAATDVNVFSFTGTRRSSSIDRKLFLNALSAEVEKKENASSFLSHAMMNTMVTERAVSEKVVKYKPKAIYPKHSLAGKLKNVAALIASGQKTRVYFVSHGGFDTHANQVQKHSLLLKQLSESMSAFQKDLVAHGLENQVMTMTFSEFGRRPSENDNRGTDHGTAAPLFVMGSKTKGGVYGDPPSLDLEPNQDLTYSTDFRSVYGTVVDRWFENDSSKILQGKFPNIEFL